LDGKEKSAGSQSDLELRDTRGNGFLNGLETINPLPSVNKKPIEIKETSE
jgi:hypothetical protein